MKKVIALTFMTILLLVACQPTPEKVVVVGKGEEQIEKMIDKAVATPKTKEEEVPDVPVTFELNTYQAPDKLEYSLHSEVTGAIITVDINAPIILPEYVLPIVSVRPKDMTYEQISPIIDMLKGDKSLYHKVYAERITLKSDIQHRIDKYMWEIAMCEDDPDMKESRDFYQKQIKKLYEEMELAPETYADANIQPDTSAQNEVFFDKVDKTCTTPTPVPDRAFVLTEDFIGPFDITQENYDKSEYSLLIGEGYLADDLRIKTKYDEEGYQQLRYMRRIYNGVLNKSISTRYIPGVMDGFDFSAEDAIEIVEPYVEAIDPMLVLTDVGGAIFTDFSKEDNPSYPFGYTLFYTRRYNGVDTNYADPFTLNRTLREATGEPGYYQRPYPQEYLSITVGEDGVQQLLYTSPLEVLETIANNVELLPFEDIKEKFDAHIVLNSMNPNSEIYMKINRIELGMMRIAKPNSDAYLVIPVWDFYGGSIMPSTSGMLTNEQKAQIAEFYGRSFLTINAIDGSIINREYGY